MRKTRKSITAFVLSFLMLFTLLPAGAANIAEDVAGTAYEEAAYVLGALEIMVGDAGTGAFRPNDQITRAEFARVAVSLMGMDEIASASQGVSKFADVDTSHWANGYINVATSQGLVIGVGDNLFKPEENISYQDAITVLVRALGYEPSVAGKGGYPNGYLVIAAQVGLTKNAAGAPATDVIRGIVANLANNALTIKLMEQVNYGSNASYEVVDKTILEDKLEVIKGEGQITANSDSTLYGASNLEEGSIVINEETYKAGNSNAENYLGYYVDYYAKESQTGSNDELILVRPTKARNTTIEVVGENIHSASATELQYWKNKESDSTTQKVRIAENATMIYNGVGRTFDASLLNSNLQGAVKLVEVNGDGRYDVVYVNRTQNLVVDDVIESSYKIIDKYGNASLTLDPEDQDYRFTMVDEKNNTVELKDLEEWNVLTYTISENEALIKITVSKNSVSGKVTEISEDRYTIDGKTYKMAANYSESLSLEDEGMFYLDAQGKIAAVNKSASLNKNYVYLLNAGMTGSIDQNAEFKVMDTTGAVKVYAAETTIRLNGTSGVKSEDALASLKSEGAIVRQLLNIKLNSAGKISDIETAEDKTSGSLTIDKYDFVKNYAAEDVAYKSNSGKLGRFNISDKTIVFDIPASSTDYEDYTVRTKDMFENESKYNVIVFDVTEDLTAGVVIVTNSDGKTNLETPVSVVTKITISQDADGNQIEKLYVVRNGETASYETTGVDVLVKDGQSGKVALQAGDVIQFRLNASQKLEKFDLLFDASKMDTEFTKQVSDKMTVIYGEVDRKFANSINVTVNDSNLENYTIGEAKVYSYNSSKSSNNVTIATKADIQRGSKVLIRIYDDMVAEIMTVE